MARDDVPWRLARALVIATLITSALYFAQDVFVPLVLAALLSFLLSPVVTRVERWGLKRKSAVLIISIFSFMVFGGFGWIVSDQLLDFAERLPTYEEKVEHKFQALNGKANAALFRVVRTFSDFRISPNSKTPPSLEENDRETKSQDPALTPSVRDAPLPAPVTVAIADKEQSTIKLLWNVSTGLFGPLGKVAIVVILVFFMLLGREELRDRLILVAGPTHLNMTTQALNDASERVSRYLLMQLAINSVFGAGVAIGLSIIGVPNSLMWGLLATVFRFLPYLGIFIAAGIPFLLALASPTWHQPIPTLCLFGGLELLANYVEPVIYGSRTGLSSIAVLAAALFWTWLWGPVGLLLSTPLTAVLAVMGKYVPQLEFLHILLGNEQVLEPHVRLYQRLLATDFEEAVNLFEEFTEGKSMVEAYDTIALPALSLAEMDFHRNRIDESTRNLVFESMKELIQEYGLQRLGITQRGLETGTGLDVYAAPPQSTPPILCLPARGEVDEIAGNMLAQVLQEAGIQTQTASIQSLAGEMLAMIDQGKTEVIFISAVPPAGARYMRYLHKRIRARHPKIPIVIALWNSKWKQERIKRFMGCSENDTLVATIAEAAEQITRHIEAAGIRKQLLRNPERVCAVAMKITQ